MVKIVYQGKGRDHIKYIRDAALTIWKRDGFGAKLWGDCIREAMISHIEYLEQGTEVRFIEIKIDDSLESDYYSG